MNDAETDMGRWGAQVSSAGFAAIPIALLDHQQKFDLSSTELLVLLHVIRYWVRPEEPARPNIARIAEAMDLGPASVERCLGALEKLGVLRSVGEGAYDLRVLAERLGSVLGRLN